MDSLSPPVLAVSWHGRAYHPSHPHYNALLLGYSYRPMHHKHLTTPFYCALLSSVYTIPYDIAPCHTMPYEYHVIPHTIPPISRGIRRTAPRAVGGRERRQGHGRSGGGRPDGGGGWTSGEAAHPGVCAVGGAEAEALRGDGLHRREPSGRPGRADIG